MVFRTRGKTPIARGRTRDKISCNSCLISNYQFISFNLFQADLAVGIPYDDMNL